MAGSGAAIPCQPLEEDEVIEGPIELNVFGRRLLVLRIGKSWSVFYRGSDGKRRPASDILVPDSVEEADLVGYLADLCHEWASKEHPSVIRLGEKLES
jgi:hypothetical protein